MLDVIAAYDRLILVNNKNIGSLKAYPKILTGPSHKDLHALFDRCLYIALIQNDLLIGLKYLDVSNAVGNGIEANYFARLVALNSYETFNYFEKLIGKIIHAFSADPALSEKVTAINDTGKKINILKKTCFEHLGEIRNKVIRHKDFDSLKQTDIMLQIDNKKIYFIGTALYQLNFELLDRYMELMQKI